MKGIANYISFDVMLRGRFVRTLRMPILLAERIASDGKPVFSESRIQSYVEERLPSLKGQPYNICF